MASKSCLFTVDKATGLLDPARYRESPNKDARPGGCEPTMIVVHGISLPPGEFGGPEIEALFTNTLDWDAHPYFDESLPMIADLAVRAPEPTDLARMLDGYDDETLTGLDDRARVFWVVGRQRAMDRVMEGLDES